MSEESVICSFVKCGIALPISGSRDSELKIDGLADYHMNESAKSNSSLTQGRKAKLSAFSP